VCVCVCKGKKREVKDILFDRKKNKQTIDCHLCRKKREQSLRLEARIEKKKINKNRRRRRKASK